MDPEVQKYLSSLSPQALAALYARQGIKPEDQPVAPQSDFYSDKQGQRRSAWLNDLSTRVDAIGGRVADTLRYFGGPGFSEAGEKAGRAALALNPAEDVKDMQESSAALTERVAEGDLLGAGRETLNLGGAAAMTFLPGHKGAIDETVDEYGRVIRGIDPAAAVPTPAAVPEAWTGGAEPAGLSPPARSAEGLPILDEAAQAVQAQGQGVGVLDAAAPFDLEAAVNAPSGSDPRYLGAAPDRTNLSFLRYPPKASTARTEKALTALRDPENPVRAELMETIQRGVTLGGADWYNTEELRDWFVGELGEKEGHAQWEEFMDLMGTNSAGSNVQQNLASASAVRQRMANDPAYVESSATIEKLPEGQALARGRPDKYGHQYQGLQELTTAKRAQGEWQGAPEPGVPAAQGSWVENQKPKGFAQSLKGSMGNIAADLHFTRFMAMGSKDPEWLSGQMKVGGSLYDRLASNPKLKPYLRTNEKGFQTFNAKKAAKDGNLTFEEAAVIGDETPDIFVGKPESNEYKDFEDFTNEIGREMNLTGPQVQAALWMGAANKTGVSDMSAGTFMDIIRARADATAKKTGRTRAEVMKSFIRDKGLLSIAPLGALPFLGQLGVDEDERSNTGNAYGGGA